jgi:hypothetical protein
MSRRTCLKLKLERERHPDNAELRNERNGRSIEFSQDRPDYSALLRDATKKAGYPLEVKPLEKTPGQ